MNWLKKRRLRRELREVSEQLRQAHFAIHDEETSGEWKSRHGRAHTLVKQRYPELVARERELMVTLDLKVGLA